MSSFLNGSQSPVVTELIIRCLVPVHAAFLYLEATATIGMTSVSGQCFSADGEAGDLRTLTQASQAMYTSKRPPSIPDRLENTQKVLHRY